MKAIMACDPDGGVGYQGRLPWAHLDGDLLRFKTLTQGSSVVMGRSTWDSLPLKPLPKRHNIVLSSHKLELPKGATQLTCVEDLALLQSSWFIGGARLLESVWCYIDEFHLSRTHQQYSCDVKINLLHLEANYEKVSHVVCQDHDYEIWKRK